MISQPNPPYAYHHPTEFRVGSALSRAIEVLFGHFVPFVTISAIAAVPLYLLGLAQVGTRLHTSTTWLELLLGFVLNALCEAMIIYATFQALRGRPVRAGESIGRGLQRFGPVLLASFLVTLVVAVGSLLLLVPGIIAFVMFYVTLPVCVVERLGPGESMERSSALTRGYRWPIFGAFLAYFVIAVIVEAIADGVTGAIGGPPWLAQTVSFVVNAITQAYSTVLVAIIYHDLRVLKDGIDLEQIAAVFD